MSHLSQALFFDRKPPSNVATSRHQVVSNDLDASAEAWDWTAALTTATAPLPDGDVWVCLEAVVSTIYVRFGPATSTATTAKNGTALLVGVPQYFYVNPTKHKFIDHLAVSSGSTLKLYVCSSIGARNTI